MRVCVGVVCVCVRVVYVGVCEHAHMRACVCLEEEYIAALGYGIWKESVTTLSIIMLIIRHKSSPSL